MASYSTKNSWSGSSRIRRWRLNSTLRIFKKTLRDELEVQQYCLKSAFLGYNLLF